MYMFVAFVYSQDKPTSSLVNRQTVIMSILLNQIGKHEALKAASNNSVKNQKQPNQSTIYPHSDQLHGF